MKKLQTNNSKLQTSSILVSGSLVYDTIFSLNGTIREQIQVDCGIIGKQNFMFTGNAKEIYFGGTGGNIAFGLTHLGLSPLLVSLAGKDAFLYEEYLKQKGVGLRLKKSQDGFTPTFYGLTDGNKEQIGIYQGGVANDYLDSLSLTDVLNKTELEAIKTAIFSPGTAKSMTKQIIEFRKINKKALVIFDPGQMLAIDFTKEKLEKAFKNSNIGIFNDTEFSILQKKFGFTLEKIVSLGLSALIETKGKDGAVLYEKKDSVVKETLIKTKQVKKVLDPTGAGDAFRAGMIGGLEKGFSLPKAMEIGAELGAECVKYRGCQTYGEKVNTKKR